MNFIKNLFNIKEKQYKIIENKAIAPSELVKQSTAEFRLKKYDDAINLILKAISIEFQAEWYDKLANYYYKCNNTEMAFKTLEDLVKKIEKKFINQFNYDYIIIKRKSIWEKDKIIKQQYEAILHIKQILSYCMSGDYESYPKFEIDFLNDDINQETNNYLSTIKPILIKINDIVKKIMKEYEKNYLKYNFKDESTYEITDQLIKNNNQVIALVNELKKHKLPFF